MEFFIIPFTLFSIGLLAGAFIGIICTFAFLIFIALIQD